MSNDAFDIVIVGAGGAGCVVASYLADHTNASIALAEIRTRRPRRSRATARRCWLRI